MLWTENEAVFAWVEHTVSPYPSIAAARKAARINYRQPALDADCSVEQIKEICYIERRSIVITVMVLYRISKISQE